MGGKPGRKWGPLRSEYEELGELATALRGVADGHGVTLRDLEARMSYQHTAISERLNGAARPEWRFVVEFLTACAGGDRHALSELERKIRPLWESAGQRRTPRTALVAAAGSARVPTDVRTWVAQLHETARTLQVVTELQSSVNRNVGLVNGLTFLLTQTSTAVTTLSAERETLRKELAAREADARELHQTRQELDDTQRRLAAAERMQTEMTHRLYEALRQRQEAENLKQQAIAQAEMARRRLAELEGHAVAFTSHSRDSEEATSSPVTDLMGPTDQTIAGEILRYVDTTLGDEAASLRALHAQVTGTPDATPGTAELSAGESLSGASASADNHRGNPIERMLTGGETSVGSPDVGRGEYDDPAQWHLASTPRLPPDMGRGLAALARNLRPGDDAMDVGSPDVGRGDYDDPTQWHLASTPRLPPDLGRGLAAHPRNWPPGDDGLDETRQGYDAIDE